FRGRRAALLTKPAQRWPESCRELDAFISTEKMWGHGEMLKPKSLPILAGAAALGALIAATPAYASLVADGITYTLTETPLTATTAHFDLMASGINGVSDTEGGRFGVNAF